jgi:hypothetical protein
VTTVISPEDAAFMELGIDPSEIDQDALIAALLQVAE